MTQLPTCPQCHQLLPEGVPVGRCPHCLLLAAAQDSGPHKPGSFVPPTPDELNQRLEAFEVLSLLGRGGMGAVYKAIHLRLDRVVAIKLLPHELAESDPAFGERFLREARSLAKLQHPNLVVVHDFGEVDGLYFIVMEYVEGPTLRRLLQEGALTPERALAILPQICEGLRYAHEQGLVHRDIKPENILIGDDGRVRITDFGLARLTSSVRGDISLTGSAQSLGTPHYMAPEQLRDPDSVDHRADIFALGVVFYEMLTGHLPHGRFPLPSTESGVGKVVDEVVLRSLEPDPNQRYQRADDVERALGQEASPEPPPRVEQPKRRPEKPVEIVDEEASSYANRALGFAIAATVTSFLPWGSIQGSGYGSIPWDLGDGTISVWFITIPLWMIPAVSGILSLLLVLHVKNSMRLTWKILSRVTMGTFLVCAFGLGIGLWSMANNSGEVTYGSPTQLTIDGQPVGMDSEMASAFLDMLPSSTDPYLSPGPGVFLTTLMLLLLWFPLHRLARRQAGKD